MRTLMPVVALALGAIGASYYNRPAAAEDNPIKLDGEYTLVSGERDGKPIPEEKIKGAIVKFTGDRIVGTDKDRKEFFAATFTLDTTTSPWAIKMKSTTPKDSEAKGVIKREGDKITIAYALPGGATPTEFKTKEKQHLFVLKSMNAKK
jgi:uncharacterized protein (TIGR03067 family)